MKKKLFSLLGIVFIIFGFNKEHYISKNILLFESQEFYLDSENGSDLNDGLLPSSAFKTAAYSVVKIEEYRAVNPNTQINLNILANSIFKRDPLIIDIGNLTIRKYGSGENPIFDGSLELNNFTHHSGSVYEVTVDYSFNIDGNDYRGRPVIYENGKTLQPVATLQECEALAGSYIVQQGDESLGVVHTTQFHPSNSGDPLTNGKIYSTNQKPCIIAKPSSSLIDLNNVNLENIDAQYAFNATPSKVTSRSPNSVVKNCQVNNGTKHHFHFEKNTLAENLIAFGNEIQGQYGRTASAYVCYSRSATLEDWMHYKNCLAILTEQKNGQKLGSGSKAFEEHHAGENKLGRVIYDDCYAFGYGTAIAANSESTEVNNCFFENLTGILIRCKYNLNVQNTFINGVAQTDNLGLGSNGYTHEYINSILTNFKYGRTSMDGRLDLENCIITTNNNPIGTFSNGNFIHTNANPGYISSYGCAYLFYKFSLCVSSNQYEGDYNIFSQDKNMSDQIMNKLNGSTITSLSEWQNQTGQDKNSVYLTAEQQRDFLITDPFTGDAIINVNAKVTGADGTIYVGVFPDGTKISDKLSNKEFSHRKIWDGETVLNIKNKDNKISKYNIYPNPIDNKNFTISTESTSLKDVKIFNLNGKEVYKTRFLDEIKDIDISELSLGLYVLKITENSKVSTHKLIVE